MLKKTVTYTDFNGTERTEDFYFNLTEAELTEMELEHEGGFHYFLEKIIKSQSVPELIKWFKIILLKAYGVKSDDGRRFIKNDEVRAEFEQSQAFSDIYMEFVNDDNAAADFVNRVMPEKYRTEVAKAQAQLK